MRFVKSVFVLSVLMCITRCSTVSKEPVQIIPEPCVVKNLRGCFTLDHRFAIIVSDTLSDEAGVAGYAAKSIRNILGKTADISEKHKPSHGSLVLNIAKEVDSNLGSEGYTLQVSPDAIEIHANTGAGLFYGVQTLFQLLPHDVFSESSVDLPTDICIPCVRIEDRPRYSYRGMHLDVARHFFPVSFIKKYIDYIAMHKMNVLHWHLTEDQGWRIEIPGLEKLTSVGSWRKQTLQGHYSDQPHTYDNTPYGGYYTTEEVKEVLAYAAERYVTVIPEIEMPGHSRAALAAYPELSCAGGPFEVMTKWGVSKDIYCAGKEETFAFLEKVLTHVMALFPSEYIHIGGDEAPKDRWEDCPDCQRRIQSEGLKNEHELQSYFIARMEKFINSHGRRIIGWDEILEGGLAPNATVMSWRGMSGGIAAARAGHDVIMTPTSHCYFDYYQGDADTEPLAIGGLTTLEKVYSFEPTPGDSLTDDQEKYILGGQANLWTEYIKTPSYAEYMVLPRMCALAEVLWSSETSRDWEDFQDRLDTHFKRLYAKGAHFRIPLPRVAKAVTVHSHEPVRVGMPLSWGIIRYTLDGTDPGEDSKQYEKPFIVENNCIMKSAVFLPNGRHSQIKNTHILVQDRAPQGKQYGVLYDYIEYSTDTPVSEIFSLPAARSGSTPAVSIDIAGKRDNMFGIVFRGYINIDTRGEYSFWILADDGAQMKINDKIIIDQSAYTGKQVQGTVFLEKGLLPFSIQYYEHMGGQQLKMWYEGPGVVKQPIPPCLFVCDRQ